MRTFLWYTSWVFMIPIAIIGMTLQSAALHLYAALEVIHTVLFRWQLWTHRHPKHQLLNCPWKYTLRQVYRLALKKEHY